MAHLVRETEPLPGGFKEQGKDGPQKKGIGPGTQSSAKAFRRMWLECLECNHARVLCSLEVRYSGSVGTDSEPLFERCLYFPELDGQTGTPCIQPAQGGW